MAPIRYLVFDLDETLYPAHTGMFHEVGQRINRYLQERVGFSPEEVPLVRRRYFELYGTTLRGLQLHHQVDSDDYLTFVHDVNVAGYLGPDPALDAALSRLGQEKVIFTNATAEYARRVLRVLGLEHHFQRIFDVYAIDFHCKPDPEAYRILLQALPAVGNECLLVEDNVRNVRAGKQAGMYTVLVGEQEAPPDGADFVLPEVVQVVEVLGQLEQRRAEVEP